MPTGTQAVQKKQQQQEAVAGQQQDRYARQVDSSEKEASASASAGLNLNVLGALSGSLFSSKTKTTERDPHDGSERTREDEALSGSAQGQGAGNMSAFGQANAHARDRAVKSVEGGEGSKSLAKGKVEGKEVDHLGIGG